MNNIQNYNTNLLLFISNDMNSNVNIWVILWIKFSKLQCKPTLFISNDINSNMMFLSIFLNQIQNYYTNRLYFISNDMNPKMNIWVI